MSRRRAFRDPRSGNIERATKGASCQGSASPLPPPTGPSRLLGGAAHFKLLAVSRRTGSTPATATIRCWRDKAGASHAEVRAKRGTIHLLKQPPLESLRAGTRDRLSGLADSILPHWT
jgi:hypothetical protein